MSGFKKIDFSDFKITFVDLCERWRWLKGVTKVHRVPSHWKDTVRGKFLDEKNFYEFLFRPSLLVRLKKTLPKSLLSSTSDFVFLAFGKK